MYLDDEIIEEFMHHERMIQAAFRVPIAKRKAEALRRFQAGEKPCYSSGIDDSLTCGYGYLDENGFWEFPLEPEAE